MTKRLCALRHYAYNGGHRSACGLVKRAVLAPPEGWRTWGPVTCKHCLRYKDAIDVEELRDAIDEHGEEALAGRLCIFYDDRLYPLVMIDDELMIRVRLHCTGCKERSITVYIGYGAPGWCYAYSKNGTYRADLRNQEYVCKECSKPKEASL